MNTGPASTGHEQQEESSAVGLGGALARSVESGRRRLLLYLLPILALMCFAALPALAQLSYDTRVERTAFAGVAALQLLLLAGLLLGWLSASRVAYVTVASLGAVLLLRLVCTFIGGLFEDPGRSFFLATYAYFAAYYVLVFALLPYPLSARVVWPVWISMAAIVTVGTRPYWGQDPPRELLSATLAYVWIDQLLLVLLLGATAYRGKELLMRYESAAERERGARLALASSEAQLRAVFEHAGVGVALLDADGHWLKVNAKVPEITGYPVEELLQLDFQSITHPDDLAVDVEQARRVMAGEINGYQFEKRYIRKDGSICWVLLHVGRADGQGGSGRLFVSVIEDITERKRDEARIRALTADLEGQVAERTTQLRSLVGLEKTRNAQLGVLTDINGLFAAAADVAETGTIVAGCLPRLFPGVAGALYLRNGASYELIEQWGGAGSYVPSLQHAECWGLRFGHEHRVENPQDPLRCRHWAAPLTQPRSCIPLQVRGESLGVLELTWPAAPDFTPPEPPLLRSLAEQLGMTIANLQLREELRRQALHDPLTGLYNRRHLEEFVSQRLAEYRRAALGFAVLMIDVDHFKALNDRYGHDAGDEALAEIAALLKRSVRSEEGAFRHGGEEFLLVIRCVDVAEALAAAERIRGAVEGLRVRPRSVPGAVLKVSVSVGVAVCPDDAADFRGLVSRADEGVYAAKAAGRNRVCRALPAAS